MERSRKQGLQTCRQLSFKHAAVFRGGPPLLSDVLLFSPLQQAGAIYVSAAEQLL